MDISVSYTTMTRSQPFSQIPLFADMSSSALSLLGARAAFRTAKANTFLFHAGDAAPGLIVVLEGRVRVFREIGGRRAVLHVEGPGGTLGDVPTFAGGTLPASAMALEPTRYLVVPRALLESLVVLDPQLALRLLERMAWRVREVVSRVDRLVFQHVAMRLARYLIVRSERSRTPNVISLGLTQQELAD
ncbi:MAG: Crp/Fnr family transcriptional regulator, partial [Gemmatimonadaceae bacterium]